VDELLKEIVEEIKLKSIFDSFREDLLSKIKPCTGRIVMHVIPYDSLDPMKQIVATSDAKERLCPMGSSGGTPRYNAEGLRNESNDDYIQLFRNGVIESVKTFSVYDDNGEIAGPDLEDGLITGLKVYLEAEKILGIEPPLLVMISMIGVEGHFIYPNPNRSDKYKIDSERVVPAPIEVTSYENIDYGQVLKPVLDTIWQAAGIKGSPFYNADGDRNV
jgi:hypothetical protein